MATIAMEGVGATVAFATNSSYAADLISLNLPEQVREALETTHLGTTTAKTYKAATLKDVGDIGMVFDYDPTEVEFIEAAEEAITINLPLQSGEATPAKLTFNGFCISEGGQELAVDTLMRTNRTFKVNGDLTITPAVAAS